MNQRTRIWPVCSVQMLKRAEDGKPRDSYKCSVCIPMAKIFYGRFILLPSGHRGEVERQISMRVFPLCHACASCLLRPSPSCSPPLVLVRHYLVDKIDVSYGIHFGQVMEATPKVPESGAWRHAGSGVD